MVNPLHCLEVTAECPATESLYGYYPSLPANAFFLAIFFLGLILNLVLGTFYKTWTYMLAMSLACLSLTIGYIGRVLLHSNPFGQIGFEMQICCLTMAPAFNAAAIYLTLKHITLCFGPEVSRLRPKYYTWIFIIADLLALIFQGSGGGLAASAGDNANLRDVGNNLMMTGLSWQVVTLTAFGLMAGDYALRRKKSASPLSVEAKATKVDIKFKIFISGLTVTYFVVLIRCVYRIAEMAGGWRNPIMQDEALFIALDSCMITLAVLLQTLLHPGIFFPRLSGRFQQTKHGEKFGVHSASSSLQV